MENIDVSRLPFDLNIIGKIQTKEKLFKAYPILERYPAFKAEFEMPFPRVFELVVLLYSIGSPLLVRHDTRKAEAAEYFGHTVVDGEIQNKYLSELLSCENEKFNDMVVAYCRLQKNAKFSKMVTFMDAYYAVLPKIRMGGTDKQKMKELLESATTLENEIDYLVNDFLNQDNVAALKDKVFEEIEIVSLGLRPEDIAEKLENGEEPVDIKPYGVDYNFEKFGDRTKINPLSDSD
jgi:hypothetical protein